MFEFNKSINRWYNWTLKSKTDELLKRVKTTRIRKVLIDIYECIEKEIEEISDLEDAEAYIRYFAYCFLENRKYFEEMRDEALKEHKENRKFKKLKDVAKDFLKRITEEELNKEI